MTTSEIEIFFQKLGLSTSASQEEIREAYKDLVKVWHPDRFQSDPKLSAKAQEKLKEINDAYQRVLDYRASDPKTSAGTRTNSRKNNKGFEGTQGPSSSQQGAKKSEHTDAGNGTNGKEAQGSGKASNSNEGKVATEATQADDYSPFSVARETLESPNKRFSTVFVITAVVILGVILAYNTNPRQKAPTRPTTNSKVDTANVTESPVNTEVASNTVSDQKTTSTANKISENSNSTSSDEDPLGLFEPDNVQTVQTYPSPALTTTTIQEPTQPTVVAEAPQALSSGDSFTLNSSRNDVLRVQGTPDNISGSSYSYRYSTVYFEGDRVTGWSNISKNLRVRLESHSRASYFTLGSARDDVVSAQGTPDNISGNSFGYGYSTIYFRGDEVVGWSNISRNLRARMFTSSSTTDDRFTIGASKDDVIKIQGTPDNISGTSYGYGYSTIYFRNDRVIRWSNIDGKLKVILRPE